MIVSCGSEPQELGRCFWTCTASIAGESRLMSGDLVADLLTMCHGQDGSERPGSMGQRTLPDRFAAPSRPGQSEIVSVKMIDMACTIAGEESVARIAALLRKQSFPDTIPLLGPVGGIEAGARTWHLKQWRHVVD